MAEVRDEKASQSELESIALQARASVFRDQGLGVAAILLLRPHAARKTTSGKIARSWNKRAYLSRQSDPSSPWHASTGAVLFEWRELAGAEEQEEVAMEALALASTGTNGEASAGTGPAAVTGSGGAGAVGGATAAGAGAPTEDAPFKGLEGDALRTQLRADIASMVRCAPAQVDPSISLHEQGVDSLMLTQIAGMLAAQYGIAIKDEHMFNEGTTISWIAANAAALRSENPPIPPGAPGPHAGPGTCAPDGISTGGGAAAAAAGGGGGQAGGASSGATSAREPALVGAGGASSGGVHQAGGVATVDATMGRPFRRKDSWFQRNCPCCIWCW